MQNQVRIGVLAKRGPQRCMEKWSLTAEYLSEQIPGHTFEIVPLGCCEVAPAVKAGDVDFVLTNSSLYVEAEALYGASRIATLKNLGPGGACTTYGGVIFCRANRNDIKRLADLKGKRFMAAGKQSFGGWQMAWREMKENGINPHRDFKQLLFGETHDAVVYAVRDGRVDAGTVRTDTLERMQAEGKTRMQDFIIIHSTRLYPEWPFAKVRHTSQALAEKVANALLGMSPESPAARSAKCFGWTIPLNYQPVHDCLKELCVGPYKDYGKVTLGQSISQHWYWLVIIAVAPAPMAVVMVHVLKLNRRLHRMQTDRQIELTERKRADKQIAIFRRFADASGQGFAMATLNHELTYVNATFCHILGEDSPDDALGKRFVSYYSEETQERLRNEILPSVLQGEQWVGELNLVSTAGLVIPTTTNFFTIRDENDNPIYYAGVFSDITERNRAEENLRAASQYTRSLIEASLAVRGESASSARARDFARVQEAKTQANPRDSSSFYDAVYRVK
ncbi:MAG: PhnD/SsuA/transferrin family substrate-binding protein, partial [Planctomycetota bacterium]|nr:PhnD/SsuA/transferrin family substrate-binding protein [Planctomycetota bacterium]